MAFRRRGGRARVMRRGRRSRPMRGRARTIRRLRPGRVGYRL